MDAPQKSTVLTEFADCQEDTFQLLSLLRDRLENVSEQSPAKDEVETKAASKAGHVNAVLNRQYIINNKLRQLIDELVV